MSKVITPVFRVSFPNIFEARKNDLSGKEEYSLTAIFPKDADLTKMKAAAQEAMVKKWGADKNAWPTNIRSPFRDQAERAKTINGKQVLPDGYVAGAVFMNFKSQQKPGVVDKNVQVIIDASEFYAGCYAIASVMAFAYDNKGNRGVSFGLLNIQKVKEGDPLGTRTKPENDFAPVEGGETNSNLNLFD